LSQDQGALLALAVRAARLAGQHAREWFTGGRSLDVREKEGPRDLVSAADLACERLILELLRRERPEDAIAGEETEAIPGTTGLRWGVDPIDGTTNFVSGVPHWCVSIGCEDPEGSLVGVVYDPMADELFAAARGSAPTLNGAPLPQRRDVELAEALLAFGIDPDWWAGHGGRARSLDRLLPAVAHGRLMGSLALDMGWAAAGRFDVYCYESKLLPHDIAQRVLLEAAGLAVVVEPATDRAPGALLAAPPQLLDELLRAARA
jgi:myo-inositol-1(or 4)-monophosphatase